MRSDTAWLALDDGKQLYKTPPAQFRTEIGQVALVWLAVMCGAVRS